MKVLRFSLTSIALITSLGLAACGGGGGSALPGGNNGGSTQSVNQQTEDSINTADAVGSPVKDVSSFNESTNSPASASFVRTDVTQQTVGDGTCHNGVEFFVPDKNHDASSTERIDFYDNACTQIARDTVRVYSSTGANSETVARTISLYAMNSSTPQAVRTENVTFSNATFDQYGYPVVADGLIACTPAT